MGNFKEKINKSKYARYISAAFMAPFALFLALGGVWLYAVVNIMIVVAMNEFYNGFKNRDIKVPKWIGYTSWAMLFVLELFHVYLKKDIIDYSKGLTAWIFITMIMSLCYCFIEEDNSVFAGPLAALGVFYVAFLGERIALVRELPKGKYLIWLVLIVAIASDAGAYFCGRKWGSKTRKMAPNLSPNKTMAGLYGGLFCAALCSFVFGCIFMKEDIAAIIVMGLLGSLLSTSGDLAESAFKRKMGLKDYSDLIPGHGGMMDRIDSLMFTSSFVYFYAVFVL